MDAADYRPRDVINAPQLREALLQRSRLRDDHPALSHWLANHFWRALIGSFAGALRVVGEEGWRSCFPGRPVPHWFARSDQLHWFIDPQHPRLLDTEQRLVEYLRLKVQKGQAHKLPRITCEQALTGWHVDHARLQRAWAQGRFHSQPAQLREVLVTSHGRIVEIHGHGEALRMELAYESSHMQHCLGHFVDRARLQGGYGEHYARRISQREIRLFSLRDSANRPHVTVSLERTRGGFRLEQVKGKQNRPPVARYREEVAALLDHLKLSSDDNADCQRAGLIDIGEVGSPHNVHYTEAPTTAAAHRLWVQAPWLLTTHRSPRRAEAWLALAGDVESIFEAQDPPLTLLAAALLTRDPCAVPTPCGTPDWFVRLQTLAGCASDDVTKPWCGRLSVSAPIRWLRAGWLHDPLREARRWALATTDLKSRALGIFRRANANPRGGLSRARARVLLQALEQQQGHGWWSMLRASFGSSRLQHPGLRAVLRAERFDPLDIIAFESIEGAHVTRLALAAAQLSPALGVPLLLLHAQRLRDCFEGWEAMARAYSRGRHAVFTWQSPGMQRNYRVDRDIDAYLQDPRCNWHRLVWGEPELLSDEQLAQRLMPLCRSFPFYDEAPHDSQSHR